MRPLADALWRLTKAPAAWFAEFVDTAEDIWERDPLLDQQDEWLCC